MTLYSPADSQPISLSTPSKIPPAWPEQLLQYHAKGRELLHVANKQYDEHTRMSKMYLAKQEERLQEQDAVLARQYNQGVQAWHAAYDRWRTAVPLHAQPTSPVPQSTGYSNLGQQPHPGQQQPYPGQQQPYPGQQPAGSGTLNPGHPMHQVPGAAQPPIPGQPSPHPLPQAPFTYLRATGTALTSGPQHPHASTDAPPQHSHSNNPPHYSISTPHNYYYPQQQQPVVYLPPSPGMPPWVAPGAMVILPPWVLHPPAASTPDPTKAATTASASVGKRDASADRADASRRPSLSAVHSGRMGRAHSRQRSVSHGLETAEIQANNQGAHAQITQPLGTNVVSSTKATATVAASDGTTAAQSPETTSSQPGAQSQQEAPTTATSSQSPARGLAQPPPPLIIPPAPSLQHTPLPSTLERSNPSDPWDSSTHPPQDTRTQSSRDTRMSLGRTPNLAAASIGTSTTKDAEIPLTPDQAAAQAIMAAQAATRAADAWYVAANASAAAITPGHSQNVNISRTPHWLLPSYRQQSHPWATLPKISQPATATVHPFPTSATPSKPAHQATFPAPSSPAPATTSHRFRGSPDAFSNGPVSYCTPNNVQHLYLGPVKGLSKGMEANLGQQPVQSPKKQAHIPVIHVLHPGAKPGASPQQKAIDPALYAASTAAADLANHAQKHGEQFVKGEKGQKEGKEELPVWDPPEGDGYGGGGRFRARIWQRDPYRSTHSDQRHLLSAWVYVAEDGSVHPAMSSAGHLISPGQAISINTTAAPNSNPNPNPASMAFCSTFPATHSLPTSTAPPQPTQASKIVDALHATVCKSNVEDLVDVTLAKGMAVAATSEPTVTQARTSSIDTTNARISTQTIDAAAAQATIVATGNAWKVDDSMEDVVDVTLARLPKSTVIAQGLTMAKEDLVDVTLAKGLAVARQGVAMHPEAGQETTTAPAAREQQPSFCHVQEQSGGATQLPASTPGQLQAPTAAATAIPVVAVQLPVEKAQLPSQLGVPPSLPGLHSTPSPPAQGPPRSSPATDPTPATATAGKVDASKEAPTSSGWSKEGAPSSMVGDRQSKDGQSSVSSAVSTGETANTVLPTIGNTAGMQFASGLGLGGDGCKGVLRSSGGVAPPAYLPGHPEDDGRAGKMIVGPGA